MGHDFTDDALYGPGGVFYPRGYVFAMFLDAAAAQVAVTALAALAEIGSVQLVSSATIVERMSPRAADRGMPSVGREDQFMRRFVELARDGMDGVLIEVGHAVPEAIAQVLEANNAALAYHYRTLVIEELVDTKPRAEAAAAGKL